ncbi:MAG: hypothetical protein ACOZBZ_04480 [Patescibacteria group bacterium]
MENQISIGDQNSQQIGQNSINPLISNKQDTKPVWQSDAFIILTLLLFWPVGLFLMWKYGPWRKLVKWLLTVFFTLAWWPVILIFLFIVFLKGVGVANKAYYSLPMVKKNTDIFSCSAVTQPWGKCKNTEVGFSFEYPADWYYKVVNPPKDIVFSDKQEKLEEAYIISLYHDFYDTEERAKRKEDVNDKELVVNGLWATRHDVRSSGIYASRVKILYNRTLYTFQIMLTPGLGGRQYSETELKNFDSIFDHMWNSFQI